MSGNANAMGSKKRHHPSEMMHRFSCKDDFLNYFKNQSKFPFLILLSCLV